MVAKAQSATVKSKSCEGLKSPTLRRAWPRDGPEAAICVQGIDVQCVLQFTLIHAAGCALHRRTSRVIHRSKLCFFFSSYREFARVLALKATIFFFSKMKKGNEALRAPGEAPEEGKGGHTFKKKGRLFEPRVAHEQRAELSTGDRIYLPTQVPKSFREVERGAVAAVKCNLSILTVPGSDRTTRQPLFEPNDPANSLPQQPRRAKGGAFAREEATSRHRGSFSSKRYPEKG